MPILIRATLGFWVSTATEALAIPLCFLMQLGKARVLKDGKEKSTTETDPTRAKLTGRASVLSEEEEEEER